MFLIQDIAFTINFILVIFFAYLLLYHSGISPFEIHPMPVTLGFYFLSSYIGIPVLYYQLDAYRIALGVTDQFTILKLWAVNSIVIFVICCVFCLLSYIISKTTFYYSTQIELTYSPIFYFYFIFFIFLSFFSLAVYIKQIGSVPLLHIFSQINMFELAAMRSNATNAFAGKYHWFVLLTSTIPAFLSYIALGILLRKRCLKNLCFFIIPLSLSFFSSIMNLEKAPLVWYIVGLAMVVLLNRNTRFSVKNIFFLSVSFFIILVFSYSFFMKSSSPVSSILSRVTTGELAPGYYYLDVFPNKIDFLVGKSFPNPKGIFPWGGFNLPLEIMNIMVPSIEERGIKGSAPTAFWGELYANFGYLGVVLGSVLVGIILWFSSYLIHKKRTLTPVHTATIAWLILHFQKLSVSSFTHVFVNINILAILLLSFIFSAAVKKRSNKNSISRSY